MSKKLDNTNVRCSFVSVMLRGMGPGTISTDLDCLLTSAGAISDFNAEPFLFRRRTVDGKHIPTGVAEFKRNHGGGSSRAEHKTQLEVLSGLYNADGEQLPCFFVRYEFNSLAFDDKHVSELGFIEAEHRGKPVWFVEACNEAAVKIVGTAKPTQCTTAQLSLLFAQVNERVDDQHAYIHNHILPELQRRQAPAWHP